MIPSWLREAVAACKNPSTSPGFPREMDRVWALLVHVEPIAQITPEKVKAWLEQVVGRVEHSFERDMHGCMAAAGETGFIFCDSTDAPHVQNFTVAHELGHYVLEHLLPRKRAQRALGANGLRIFDGGLTPTPAETLYSILGHVPLRQPSLMNRTAAGEPDRGKIDEAEYRADRVAFELLAPAAHVLPRVKGLPRAEAVALLKTGYGLPESKARAYARLLLGSEHPGFRIRDFFGGEDDE